MAYYEVKTNSDQEFLDMLRERNDELVTAMVEGVLSAIDTGLKKIDLVEVINAVGSRKKASYVISIVQEDYETMLTSCMEDMIRLEKYELCSKIKAYLDSLETKQVANVG
jgi:transcription antitermination factor NusA-like protein